MRAIIEASLVRLARDERAAYCGFTEFAVPQGLVETLFAVPPMHPLKLKQGKTDSENP